MQKTRRDFLKKAGIGAMGLPGLIPVTEAMSVRKETTKPNIILVLTDDQSWMDTSVQMMTGRADYASEFPI